MKTGTWKILILCFALFLSLSLVRRPMNVCQKYLKDQVLKQVLKKRNLKKKRKEEMTRPEKESKRERKRERVCLKSA